MADGHEWFKLEGTDLMDTVLFGTYNPVVGSNPTISSNTEGAWTVTRVSASITLVKFKNALPRIKAVHASVCSTTGNIAVNAGPIIQGTAVAGGTTIQFQTYTANTGALFDMPANAQNMVSFVITFSNDGSQSLKN